MVGTISVEPHSGHGRAGLLAAGRRAGNFFIADLLIQNHCILRVNRRFAENRHFLFGSGRLSEWPPSRRATVCASPLGWLCSMRRRDIWPIEERGFSSMASSALFAELSECLLNQLDGGRGIENFLLIQVDIFDAVLAAVGGGNLLFRDIDP